MARLQASRAIPLIMVVAPTGYGKTTLLAQWAAKDRRPFAWLTLDEDDNDPTVLLTSIADALDRVGPVDPKVFDFLASVRVAMIPAAVHRLIEALDSMSRPTVLALDNVSALHNLHCVKAIEMLSTDVPAKMQVALAGRSWPGRSFARMRSDGSVLEVGPRDLTMNNRETALLLKGMGLNVTRPTVAALTLATEGWPVGVYLAALSWREGVDDSRAAPKFSGDEQFMMEYFWSEFLSLRSPEDVRFLEETAVLDRMSGPLCDAVLGQAGSAEVLRAFESADLLLTPLDRRREWFRYHGLFREALLNRLQHRDPDLRGGTATASLGLVPRQRSPRGVGRLRARRRRCRPGRQAPHRHRLADVGRRSRRSPSSDGSIGSRPTDLQIRTHLQRSSGRGSER